MSRTTDPDFVACHSPWEMTQGAAVWLARRCAADVAAIYLSDGQTGQVRRGLHTPGQGALLPLTSLLPHRLWWKGPPAWTSAGGPSMRIVPFTLGSDGGVAVVGPFGLHRPRADLAATIDDEVRRLAAPLAAGLERFPSARAGQTDLLEAVAFQYGASLDGSAEPLLSSLREVLQAERVTWEGDALAVEGARLSVPGAVAAAEWWIPLAVAARDRRADGVGTVLSGLADLLDARHPSTRGRSLATSELAIRMAARLRLGGDRLGEVEEAASLYRVGTALLDSYPDAPAGSREHPRLPAVTAGLLAGAGRPSEVVDAVRGLSERWDGAGPEGLAGISIPAPSRIIAVAAAWLELVAPWQAGPDGRAHLATELVERRAARTLVDRAGADLDPRALGALLEETDASAAL
jgi:hypothetical protein